MAGETFQPWEDNGFLILILYTLWIYLPGFLVNTFAMMWGKWFPKTGYGPWPIDGGKNWKDGNRILGDGKTWNGLIGGSLTSGLLCIIMVMVTQGNTSNALPFVDPVFESQGWYATNNTYLTAMILGSFLGLTSLIGDATGSFFKRRKGLKREGNISSKAPLLDTIPFALSVFTFGIIFLGGQHGAVELIPSMLAILIITPLLHRSFNLIGYAIGWKDVPY